MILIVGATGTNGREALKALASAGEKVRALVRDSMQAADIRSERVELVEGDPGSPKDLEAALTGIEKAFLITAVDEMETSWNVNFIEAARVTGVRRIARLSAMGAEKNAKSIILRHHAEADRLLQESGIAWTILQPGAFMQILLRSAESIRSQGAFRLPMGGGRVAWIDARDVGAAAARILLEDGHEGKTYVLTGPEALSCHDIAGILSDVLDTKIKYIEVSPEEARAAMQRPGLSDWAARAIVEMREAFSTGRYDGVTSAVERLLGRKPIAFRDFARDHAAAFLGGERIGVV